MKRLKVLVLTTFIFSALILLVSILNLVNIVVTDIYRDTLLTYLKIIIVTLESIALFIVWLNLKDSLIGRIKDSYIEKISIIDIGISVGLLLLAAVSYFITSHIIAIFFYLLVGCLALLKTVLPLEKVRGSNTKTLRIALNTILILSILILILVKISNQKIKVENEIPSPTVYYNEQFCWEFKIPDGYTLDYKFNAKSYQKARLVLQDVLSDNSILFSLNAESVLAIAYTTQLNDSISILDTYNLFQKDLYLKVYEKNLSIDIYKEGEILFGKQLFKMTDFVVRDELPFNMFLLTSIYHSTGINILIIYMDEYKGVELLKVLLDSSFGCE